MTDHPVCARPDCGKPLPRPGAMYCSASCSHLVRPRQTLTCIEDGCDRKPQAKNLCGSHYNARIDPARRHPKVEAECGYCGATVTKYVSSVKRAANVFCDYTCRDLWRIDHPIGRKPPVRQAYERCILPPDHPARWFGATCDVSYPPCAWCGRVFTTHPDWGKWYCSRRCRQKSKDVRRRGRETECIGTYTWFEFMHIAARFNYRCAYCGDRPDQLDPDHVVPLSRGGANNTTNLLPSCRRCNGDKRDLLVHEWAEDRIARGLPPRLTSWDCNDRRFFHLTSVLAA